MITAEEKGGKAIIRIIGGIYDWWNSSEQFRANIDEMQSRGIKDVHVYIKSEGGDPVEANEIVNIIESFEGTITGEGGSLVASAATYIASKIKGFVMAKNGQFMIHKPMLSLHGKNEDEVASSLKLLKDITKDYAEVYSDQTGLTVEEIRSLWSKGDYWMTAQEAVDQGFISGLTGEQDITLEDVTRLAACGSPNIPNIPKIKTKKTDTDMKLSATALVKLGLTASATEQEVEDKINALEAKAAKLVVLEAKIADEGKTELGAKIKSIVDKAIADKKITEDYRASFVAKLEANFDVASKEIEELKPVGKITAVITPEGDSNIPEERKSWTYADYQAKDEAALNAMPKDHPEVFKALYKAQYKSEAPKELFV